MGLDLCVVEGELRFWDYHRQRFLKKPEKHFAERNAAEKRAQVAEQQAQAAEKVARTADKRAQAEKRLKAAVEVEDSRLRELLAKMGAALPDSS